jgi:type II secretion system protein H
MPLPFRFAEACWSNYSAAHPRICSSGPSTPFYSIVPSSPSSRRTRGFTLVEVLLVLLIIGIMAALALPSVGKGFRTVQLRKSAQLMAATLRHTRAKAIREQMVYLLRLDLHNQKVEVFDEDKKYHREFGLPEGITMKRISLLRGDKKELEKSRIFTFFPNGMTESFEVLITNSKGREIRVIQDGWTDSPRIEEFEK